MNGRSGAGASVSSGADYQARVAAYAIANALIGVDMAALDELRAAEIGHEVREHVDDLLIRATNGIDIYIQAKRQLTWSLSVTADLGSTIAQFARQHASGRVGLYALATTSASSRRITAELSAALFAFRSGPPEAFFRDQSASLIALIRDLRAAIPGFATTLSPDQVDDLLRRMRVARLDLDDGEPLQQALRMGLAIAGFTPDALVWPKLVADCLDAGRRRLTLRVAGIRQSLSKDVAADPGLQADDGVHSGIAFAAGQERFMCGEDWLFGRFDEFSGWAITQLRRYDDRCTERTAYLPDGKARFGDVLFSVLVRASSYTGVLRMLDRHADLVAGEEIKVFPANLVEDPNESPCARQQEEQLHRLLAEAPHLRDCVRCGLPIIQARVDMIETWLGPDGTIEAGVVHDRCRFALDRVIGEARLPFYEAHPELEGFDVNSWVTAANLGGQGVLGGLAQMRQSNAVVVWSGRTFKSSRRNGAFVIALELEGGGDAFLTERATLQRYTRAAADSLARTLSRQVARDKDDPFCIILETQKAGNRSALLSTEGLAADIRAVCKVSVTPYTRAIGNRYPAPVPYYAPLTYLAVGDSDEIFTFEDAAVILSDPLSLAKHFANWTEAGLVLPSLELVALLTDDDVDAFMTRVDDQGMFALINPVLAPGDPPRVISGTRLVSQERVIASYQ